MADDGEWSIRVDGEACLMSGLCMSLAPDVFREDDDHRAVALTDRSAPDGRLLEAAEFCPAEAIAIRDLTTGEPIEGSG
ncbi:ferredoxin [Streptomyces sp. NPDC051130]|uniref:ferredoxin n=1 Tax=Streptomyces sp. NPDC051130 TaxID=3157223 RepID=UPI00343DE4C6